MVREAVKINKYKCIYSQTAKCPEYTGKEKGCPLTDYHGCRIFGKSRDAVDSYTIIRGGVVSEIKNLSFGKSPLDEKEASFEAGNDLVDIFRIK